MKRRMTNDELLEEKQRIKRDYLKGFDIILQSTRESVKEFLYDHSGIDFMNATHALYDSITPVRDQYCAKQRIKQKTWKNYPKKVDSIARSLLRKETHSTIYILRCIHDSMMLANTSQNNTEEDSDSLRVMFRAIRSLTGIWKEDAPFIQIMRYGSIQSQGVLTDREDPYKGRLIMGFGPSASGKSFWASTVVRMFHEASPRTFPDTFLSLDGGIYRMSSVMYQVVRDSANFLCLHGYKNLISTMDLVVPSLFDSSGVKKMIQSFLATQTRILPIHLYIPETLGKCGHLGVVKPCDDMLNSYVKITGDVDQWVGLLIWQHKYGSDCLFHEGYRCVGCTESGTQREKHEGKKYSNTSWEHSMKEGLKMVRKAPGGSYVIHNSGSRTEWSSMLDLTVREDPTRIRTHTILTSPTMQEQYHYTYMDGKHVNDLWKQMK